ncbi:MFS transporter [Paenibacillus hexagrammi]|uniref:MFS transporter n=1 Tax=Paenibacillus hexagrammi TaxID=2908839 RepID=A0ABY3SSB5_9BACL|nr:MFS transporter [Paenibacillus sp. YPD9-1]UJF36051.1 MFS transporter [Paenibacillus sp. YPD9-1]
MRQEKWYHHHAWTGLTALWIIGFIGAITRFIMATYQVQLAEDLHVGRGFISLAWSVNLLIAALCAPIGGRLVDRFGPKTIMLAGSLLGTCGAALVFLGHNAPLFFLGYGVVSGLSGIGASTAYVLLFRWFGNHKAKAAGILSSASSVGLAVCTPIFLASSRLTWESAFLLSALLGLLVTVPIILFFIRSDEANSEEIQSLKPDKSFSTAEPSAPSESRNFTFYLPYFIVAFALFTCGINMGTVEMNLVAIHQQAAVSPGMISISMMILGTMEIAGSIVFGTVMDVMNKRLAMTILYGIRVVSFAILLLHTPWSPIVFAVTFGLTYLGAVPGGMLIANELSSKKGRLIGSLLLFHQTGGIAGALVGGVSYDLFHHYQWLIGLDALLCVMATAGYSILAGKNRMLKGVFSHAG